MTLPLTLLRQLGPIIHIPASLRFCLPRFPLHFCKCLSYPLPICLLPKWLHQCSLSWLTVAPLISMELHFIRRHPSCSHCLPQWLKLILGRSLMTYFKNKLPFRSSNLSWFLCIWNMLAYMLPYSVLTLWMSICDEYKDWLLNIHSICFWWHLVQTLGHSSSGDHEINHMV